MTRQYTSAIINLKARTHGVNSLTQLFEGNSQDQRHEIHQNAEPSAQPISTTEKRTELLKENWESDKKTLLRKYSKSLSLMEALDALVHVTRGFVSNVI